MARTYGRLLVSIWDDPDWTALKSQTQLMFCALFSSKDVSWCGVMPYLPKRFRSISADMDARKAQQRLDELERCRFIVVDRDTDELLVRSFVRNDDLLKQPNVVMAMVKAYWKVHSDMLRAVIVDELAKAYAEAPDLKGWPKCGTTDPALFELVRQKASEKSQANTSKKAPADTSGEGSSNPSENPS